MNTMLPEHIAFYALTRKGAKLARSMADAMGGTVFATTRHAGDEDMPFDSLTDLVAETFHRFDGHVFMAAAGIVVRCIAPHIKSKETDPAVVCLDQEGRFAVSLLSGHLGGGNALADRCADVVGGQAVITTATDSAGVVSMDMLAKEKGATIGNIEQVKVVNGALLDKRTVQVFDTKNFLGLKDNDLFEVVSKDQWQMGAPGVWVSVYDDCPDADALWLYPRVLMLGVGCRRGIPGDEIFDHIRNVFDLSGLSMDAVGGLASIDAKSDEPGMLEAASSLGVEPIFYPKEVLDKVEAPNPSGMVMQRMGVGSVSEAAALLLSEGGELLVEKTKTKTVTLAVARKR
ncbi:cobalamin biosynthesis protein [Pseudodesulfovibrio sp. zrk46]|uniref:cobalt-precorrin 5A hydrolase n=1 Tax=Pseudodesulfovibrio sp. zrk46 TaxID=2725288 RepID=UPI001449359A|nr:cobalamin biosynthesis protein [Pseudodesulfovibrio sp. zrk46]QJB56475.1 cobalamin biosynthesis protein CbiG [Pseudodesulfovibrio sp. zrk46]